MMHPIHLKMTRFDFIPGNALDMNLLRRLVGLFWCFV